MRRAMQVFLNQTRKDGRLNFYKYRTARYQKF